MKEWHLYNNFTNGVQDGGRIDYVIINQLSGKQMKMPDREPAFYVALFALNE
jgi:hypothetical protein